MGPGHWDPFTTTRVARSKRPLRNEKIWNRLLCQWRPVPPKFPVLGTGDVGRRQQPATLCGFQRDLQALLWDRSGQCSSSHFHAVPSAVKVVWSLHLAFCVIRRPQKAPEQMKFCRGIHGQKVHGCPLDLTPGCMIKTPGSSSRFELMLKKSVEAEWSPCGSDC